VTRRSTPVGCSLASWSPRSQARAALWCLARSESFEAAILRASNLGDDADTTAAITGQIAGAYYGVGGIPTRWIDKLAARDQIEAFAEGLYCASATNHPNRSH